MVGREHDAVRGADDVEARIRVGQRFGVADVEVAREPLLAGQSPGGLDQRRREVQPGDASARARGPKRHRAGAGGDVKPALARAWPEARD